MRALPLLAALLLVPAVAPAQADHDTLPAGEAAMTGDSIYLLGGAWENQDGAKVSLGSFAGKPVLISMFYGSCAYACPMLITDMKRLEEALPAQVKKKLQVVLVTFDPENDTPEKMKGLLEAHGVDLDRWTMLRTDDGKMRELAAVLGIKYRRGKNGAINHSTVITLLDEQGAIAARIDGLRQSPEPIVSRLR